MEVKKADRPKKYLRELYLHKILVWINVYDHRYVTFFEINIQIYS